MSNIGFYVISLVRRRYSFLFFFKYLKKSNSHTPSQYFVSYIILNILRKRYHYTNSHILCYVTFIFNEI